MLGAGSGAGLVKKKVVIHGKAGDYMAFRDVRTDQKVLTPRERKVEHAKHERNRIQHIAHRSDKEVAQIKEMTARHKQFEEEAKVQRKTYGAGPKLPRPGMIMRVYARGKANVGGMLAKVREVASDGKSVICEMTSGKTYSLPIDHLEFAKSQTL